MVEHFRGFFVVGVWFRANLGQLSGLPSSLSITHKDLVMRYQLPRLVALLSLAAAYSSNVVAAVEGTAGVIQYAEALTYQQLLDQGEKPMSSPKYCCSLLHSPGTPESEYHFELKDAYFIRVRVDAAKLAPILFRMSCQNRGFFSPTTECSAAELKVKVDQALDGNNPHTLYGKFRGRWVVKQDGRPMPDTSKWIGQDIYSAKRESGVEDLVVGPIKGLPTSVGLLGLDELSVKQPQPSK
ncbi:hypothetical protein ACW9IO_23885 [Pseudomonas azotoformans]